MPKILLVDDNDSNLDVSRRMITKLGHEVVTVDNGPDAVELVRSQDFDLVFLDLIMPGMDGRETAQKIRDLPHKKSIVIALSGNTPSEGHVAPGLLDDYLCKPVRMDDFRKMISKWTEN